MDTTCKYNIIMRTNDILHLLVMISVNTSYSDTFGTFFIVHYGYELFCPYTEVICNANNLRCSLMCSQRPKCKSVTASTDDDKCKIHHARKGECGTFLIARNGSVYLEKLMVCV